MDMSSHLVKAVLRAKELIYLMKLYGLRRVWLPNTKEFNSTVIRILIRNGYTVISDQGEGIERNETIFSHYRVSSHNRLTVMNCPYSKPTWSNEGVRWYDDKFDEQHEIFLEQKPLTVVFTNLTERLTKFLHDVAMGIEKKYTKIGYLPSLFPHACKIWLVNQPTPNMDATVFVKEMGDTYIRFAEAIFCRVKFPYTRKPFFTRDQMRLNFADAIVIPKVNRKVKGSLQAYKITMEELAMEEDPDQIVFEDSYKKILGRPKIEVNLFTLAQTQLDYLTNFKDEADRYLAIGDIVLLKNFKELEPTLRLNSEFIRCFDKYQEMLQASKPEQEAVQGEKDRRQEAQLSEKGGINLKELYADMADPEVEKEDEDDE